MKKEKKTPEAFVVTVTKRKRPAGDFYITEQGVKIYYDINRQPLLPITERRKTFHVISLGRHSTGATTCTVLENGAQVCYRMPEELNEWVVNTIWDMVCHDKDRSGNYVFYKENGEYHAEPI